MKKIVVIAGIIIFAGCALQKSGASSNKSGLGDTRTKKVELLNDNTYLLTEMADDKSYAYDKSNPVKVGGISENIGPKNERRYLNGLLGPNGEELNYYRAGSCCHFKTPNAIYGDSGLLDLYLISWEGSPDTLEIFINMYDKGDLKIPDGLTGRKK